ncbi:PAC2 family protein [Candidatus Poriferisocius sp.]|uniref:PAC2 family protein n=1 Tax=Candidatus Poriferisocius sp. TaxID=3101276 RepID=UPI003B02A937
MAVELEWLVDQPAQYNPVMVVALEGMFDAAEAATTAVRMMKESAPTVDPLARIDPEAFFNFQDHRPEVSLDSSGNRVITWPITRVDAVDRAGAKHPLVVVDGVEPDLRWRTFAGYLVEVATRCQAGLVVTLGAMVGLAPHTRPLGVVGSSTNAELAQMFGLGRPTYEGPTGLVGALHDALDQARIPVISLRVSVPHYVPGPPNPEATRSLLKRFELITGIITDHETLDEPAAEWRERVDTAVAGDDDIRNYVAQLEQQVDEAEDLLPTGDDLAAQFEAFLRDPWK